jgi:hypothetical protein
VAPGNTIRDTRGGAGRVPNRFITGDIAVPRPVGKKQKLKVSGYCLHKDQASDRRSAIPELNRTAETSRSTLQ